MARPGVLELEDEDGQRRSRPRAEDLIGPDPAQRPAAAAGVPERLPRRRAAGADGELLAEALLARRRPCVLAMQTSVSDFYASRLAGAFYEHLARREPLLASRALADARKELEAGGSRRSGAARRSGDAARVRDRHARTSAATSRRSPTSPLDKQPLQRAAGLRRRRPGAAARASTT